MAEERLMDNGIGSMDVRRRGRRRRIAIEEQTAPRRQVAAREEVREDLATLAERFARSEGREAVRRRAEQVELGSITQDNFSQLLSELFHDGGITQERILVLFFFCLSRIEGTESWSQSHTLQTYKVECGISARHRGSMGAMQGRVGQVAFWTCQSSAGVAAGGIVSPGLLVPGCVQEVQMINNSNSNDLLNTSTGAIFWVNHNFCIFTDLISIA